MNKSQHQLINEKMAQVFDDVLSGKVSHDVANAAARIQATITGRNAIELKRAAHGRFIADLVPQWKAEHIAAS